MMFGTFMGQIMQMMPNTCMVAVVHTSMDQVTITMYHTLLPANSLPVFTETVSHLLLMATIIQIIVLLNRYTHVRILTFTVIITTNTILTL